MKALLVLISLVLCQSFAMAETAATTSEVTVMMRDCDSPYLNNNESCVTTSRSCPPGYQERTVNYCPHSNDMETQAWRRCGITCESLYRGH